MNSYWFRPPTWTNRYSSPQLFGGITLFLVLLPFGMVAAVAGIYWFLAYVAFSRMFWTVLITLAIVGLFCNK